MRARAATLLTTLCVGLGGIGAGCQTPPPPNIQVPANSGGNPYSTYEHDQVKPLPSQPPAEQYPMRGASENRAPTAQPSSASPRASASSALPPEPPAISPGYLEAYDRVGRPRIVVLLQRPESPQASMVPGDYDAIGRAVLESLAANGEVATVPINAALHSLSAKQIAEAVAGNRTALGQAAETLRADVVVGVRVEPPSGNQIKITGTARNTRDGQTIATVTSTVASPPPRRQLDFAARLLGEQMVDELSDAWNRLSAPGASPTAPAQTAPAAPNPAAPPPPIPPSRPAPTAQTAPPKPPASSAPPLTESTSAAPSSHPSTAPEPADLSTPTP